MTNYYVDDYGRLRYNQTQNPRITVPTFDYWMSVFNAAEVSAATTTSAAPTVSGSTETQNGGSDGGDIRDNQEGRGTLPEYDNARDWVDAMAGTPSVMGAGMVADAVAGRGMFSQEQQPSYTTVNGTVMNPGNPTIAEMRGAKGTNAAVTSANKEAGIEDGDYDAAVASGNEAFSGNGGSYGAEAGAEDADGANYAEGGEVMFESNKDVPGPVDGPGGPKTDSVPANLSDGEYVNTAEAVQSFGQPFFDQVNQIAKLPGAPSLMSNPDFQKMQNEFLGSVSALAEQPPTGNVPPPNQGGGLMTPSPTDPMAGGMPPMGMAEGGKVDKDKKAAVDTYRRAKENVVMFGKDKKGSLMGGMQKYIDEMDAAARYLVENFSEDKKAVDYAEGGKVDKDKKDKLAALDTLRRAREELVMFAHDKRPSLMGGVQKYLDALSVAEQKAREVFPEDREGANYAEGGKVQKTDEELELERSQKGLQAAKMLKHQGKQSLMGDPSKYEAQLKLAQDRIRQLEAEKVKATGYAEGGLVPSDKGGGLASSQEDFFDWLMKKFHKFYGSRTPSATAVINGDPALEDQRPRPKLLEDAASKAKDMGSVNEVKNEVSTDVAPAKKDATTSAVKTGALSLARRAIPGVGLASAMLESTPLNANEDEDLKAALSKPDVKESRNKDDAALPFKTEEAPKPSLAKRPAKKDTKQKTPEKTKETENKLAPNASLGDALEFYKRQDAPGFTFKGETYERSSSSPSGYELV